MRSVALAFANVLLLQSIAHRAVREERIRLGRELHDEIGPSLVSIGLGLDLAMGYGDRDDDSRDQLESLRETVGHLVEEVRTTVTRLRSAETPSLREWADSLAADAPAEGPSFIVEIDETEAPRQPEATELAAIMAEAVRNAIEHAGATTIRIEGFVRRDRGSFSVIDDGRGFDLEMRSHQRYGLIGMQERAETIAARSLGRLAEAAGHDGHSQLGTTMTEPIRIVIADDHVLVLDGMRQALDSLPDISVIGIATSGRELLRVLAQVAPDVLLVDIEMPHGTGLAVLRSLDDPPPALVVTMHADDDHRKRAQAAGASGFLSKATPLPDLAAAIRAANAGVTLFEERDLSVRFGPVSGGPALPKRGIAHTEGA